MTDLQKHTSTPDQVASPAQTQESTAGAAIMEAFEQMLREEEEKLLGRQADVSNEFWTRAIQAGQRWDSVEQLAAPATALESTNEVTRPPAGVTLH